MHLDSGIQRDPLLSHLWTHYAKDEAQIAKLATEKKVGSVIDRLHQLTDRETKREAQRGLSLQGCISKLNNPAFLACRLLPSSLNTLEYI